MLRKREHKAAVTALPGRDGRSGGGAFARRGVMKEGRLCSEGADERRIVTCEGRGLKTMGVGCIR